MGGDDDLSGKRWIGAGFAWELSGGSGLIGGFMKKFEIVDSRDWGGGGDDPEENTQLMIERIWESLTDIRARMDQQAPVPPTAVPLVPVRVVEEPVMQVEKFLRLQPPTYTGGPNPDTAEHWIHEIERVFTTMRCPAADKVVLATYQLRGFALEWWCLKMQTTFAVQQVKREQFRTLQQGFGKWGQKVKQMFKGKGKGEGGRRQFQQGRGFRPEVEESQ
ncbi:hypothetical protein Taro_034480 [Colocasia esculenta]|uniref:Retrotransposon gag domain-containing protein n=1 Tax=Colocasia esculenta TaxID=4460 RepID=A0A843WA69_COLES|nr:hypothetical protein [Colocasia esculenta]